MLLLVTVQIKKITNLAIGSTPIPVTIGSKRYLPRTSSTSLLQQGKASFWGRAHYPLVAEVCRSSSLLLSLSLAVRNFSKYCTVGMKPQPHSHNPSFIWWLYPQVLPVLSKCRVLLLPLLSSSVLNFDVLSPF